MERFGLIFLLVLVYLGGILTILSPCILPVLPFVFARSDQPFRRSGLPLLAGMAATFALVASLAAVGGAWAVRANQYGRIAALILFAVFGLTAALLFARRAAGGALWCGWAAGFLAVPRLAAARADPLSWASPPGCCGRPAPDRSWG